MNEKIITGGWKEMREQLEISEMVQNTCTYMVNVACIKWPLWPWNEFSENFLFIAKVPIPKTFYWINI